VAEEDGALATMLEIYSRREPAGTDTWSPLRTEEEMWHRVRLLIEVCRCLRRIPHSIETLHVLDVGCGIGRSSRLFVDLGVRPENLLGIDLRQSAIDDARRWNPAIRFRHIANPSEWPSESFDLVAQCTAFSSLPGPELRRQTAALMERSVGEGGYIFWWDLLRANPFAGGEVLDPKSLFPRFRSVRERRVSLYPDLSDSIRRLRGIRNWISLALSPLTYSPTHLVTLMHQARCPLCSDG
jgi:SAM-dependent methyltransferase